MLNAYCGLAEECRDEALTNLLGLVGAQGSPTDSSSLAAYSGDTVRATPRGAD